MESPELRALAASYQHRVIRFYGTVQHLGAL